MSVSGIFKRLFIVETVSVGNLEDHKEEEEGTSVVGFDGALVGVGNKSLT